MKNVFALASADFITSVARWLEDADIREDTPLISGVRFSRR